VDPTVATVVLLLLHVPPVIASLSVVVAPTHTVAVPPFKGTKLILRTLLTLSSLTYKLYSQSALTPIGCPTPAAVARPPSPLDPDDPLPAMVLIIPDVFTIRSRLLSRSAMYIFPAGSTQTSQGSFNLAAVARPPSPE